MAICASNIVMPGGVTTPSRREWSALGFARGLTPPPRYQPYQSECNPDSSDTHRNGDGVIDQKGADRTGCAKVAGVWNCIKAKPPEVTVDLKTLLPWSWR